MADPSKNIESILAALAQQRPATTPNPNPVQMPHPNAPYQQAPTPNAYPPSMPPGVQASPYAGGGYPLPQPSASGSFDLSAIKPVNSGTVSIADAIAQAKAFATEKGISYEHSRAPSASYQSHDPRAHYRSRSRSPPARREAYRDNLNPYRDERRDEHRGTSREYGRDRSMSPGPSRGHFSPRGNNSRDRGGGGGGGGGDEDTETIQIESSLVGLIIGRQGENLRRVESETGCRVQFITGPDNQGPYRQCRISGPQARRAEAKTAIDRIIEDSGMGAIARAGLDKGRGGGAAAAHAPVPGTLREGEDCMQIMVPDRTVGLIIGRGGETIRDLQERSGCHINIVGENKSVNGLRPVNLIGSREAAAQAKEHIMEIVDSDSRNVNGGGKQDRPPRNEHGRDSGPPSMGGGMGGGMGGMGGGMGGGAPGGGGDKINDSIYVPSEAVGMIIGKGGETIREMQSQTGCKINVSQSSGPGEVEREIGLVGSRDAISRAKLAIEDKVEAVRQKNSGGGGRGGGAGGRPPRRDYDNPNYSQSGSNSAAPGPSGGAPAGQPPAAAGGADPYAAYGGYQAYLALWYQALAQQQQNGQGEAPKQ